MYLALVIRFQELLRQLALKRPLFHSEADFQHALGWELHASLPNAQVRLEFPMVQFDRQRYLDIFLENDGRILALELKYKTRGLEVITRGERFELKNQSAQDLGRYDFIKDICRLEELVQDRSEVTGFAVLLTNDSAYWKQPNIYNTVDRDFRLHERRRLSGIMHWRGAGLGTMRSREDPLQLKREYLLNWHDHSRPSSASYGQFRYLIAEINVTNR